MIKKLDKINGDIEAIHEFNSGELSISRHSDNDDDDDAFTHGSQESSSHQTDEPGRGETHVTHRTDGRDWTDKKHEPDGTSPEYIDVGDDRDLDTNIDDGDEVGDQSVRMSVTDATANTAMLRSSMARARTNADKHREVRARRAERRLLQSGGEVNVGYFKIGVNKGARLLRTAMYAFHRGVGTGDV